MCCGRLVVLCEPVHERVVVAAAHMGCTMRGGMLANSNGSAMVPLRARHVAMGHASKYCDADRDGGDNLTTHTDSSPVNPQISMPQLVIEQPDCDY